MSFFISNTDVLHPALAFLGLPGGGEWIVILIVAVLVFGHRLPRVARSIGRSLQEFKRGLKDTEADIKADADAEPPKSDAPDKP